MSCRRKRLPGRNTAGPASTEELLILMVMTPKCTFFLTLLGVAAAGVPLLWLTRPAPLPAVATEQAGTAPAGGTGPRPELVPVYARVQFTGSPEMLRLSVQGKLQAELSGEAAGGTLPEPGVWETELMLPLPLNSLELEVQAQWKDEEPQAVTVTVEPPRQPARKETLWSAPGGVLYDFCALVW